MTHLDPPIVFFNNTFNTFFGSSLFCFFVVVVVRLLYYTNLQTRFNFYIELKQKITLKKVSTNSVERSTRYLMAQSQSAADCTLRKKERKKDPLWKKET